MLASIAKLRSWLPLARDVVALVIVTTVAAVTLDAAADCVFWRARNPFAPRGCNLGGLLRDVAPFIAMVVAMYWLPARWRRYRGTQADTPRAVDVLRASGDEGATIVVSGAPSADFAATDPFALEQERLRKAGGWSAGPDSESCETCAFFKRYRASSDPTSGACRRYPPQYAGPSLSSPPLPDDFEDAETYREAFRVWKHVARYELDMNWSLPRTNDGAWCGEWRHHFTFHPSCVANTLGTESLPAAAPPHEHDEVRKQVLRMWRELKARRAATPPRSGAD